MELDIKKALNSPFSEEKWHIKLILPFIVAILGLITSAFYKDYPTMSNIVNLISIIPSIILGGFYVQFAHNEIHDKTPLLPDLELGVMDFLKYGFKLLGVVLVYFSIAIIGLLLGLIAIKTQNLLALVALVLLLVGILVGFILSILAEGIFFDTFNFKEALDYKRVFKLLSKVKMEVALYFLVCICFMMFMSICNAIVESLNITIIFAAVFIAIGQLIVVNLNAQIYKVAKSRLE